MWKHKRLNYVSRSLLLLGVIDVLMLVSVKQEVEFIEMLVWLHLDFFNPAFHFMSEAHLCNWWGALWLPLQACFSWFIWPVLGSKVYVGNVRHLCRGLSWEPVGAIRYFWLMKYQIFTNMLIFSNDRFQCVVQLCVPYTWACSEPPLEMKHPFLGVPT